MGDGIIYVCNSINNKNVREGELEILRKYDDKLYFEFGSDEMNIKKRFYNDLETLNKDYNAIEKIKEAEKEIEKEETIEKIAEELEQPETEEIAEEKPIVKMDKTPKKKEKRHIKNNKKNEIF